ncbi:hypothetical protein [Methylobacterium aquaticum]|uniref:hypothetical protein n=1 Tax=Methylobacterium aquaticum TaxID=270351 RepID=UPI00193181E8|nr:hypothetical protein [Methylobacterium aquaticum]QRE77592.1 hypothetical protein F1D61_32265 [Methylobacterium aquaticum]
MRADLTVGLVVLGILAAVAPAEARGRRGGTGIVFVSRGGQAGTAMPPAAPEEEPRLRTAAADAGGPEPMTTGTTMPVAVREPAPRPAPAPVPARPWCSTGRVFGSGAAFCAIN